MMKHNKMKIVALLLSLAMISVLAGCGEGNNQIQVKTSKIETGSLSAGYSITGALVPNQVAEISTQMLGKVVSADFQEGDIVTEGQVLVQLDNSQLTAQLSQAQATYQGSQNSQEQAKINMESAKAALERTKMLYTEGAVSKVQLDTDQDAYDLAKSKYESSINSGTDAAKASLDSISVQIANSTIKSPISGVVINKNISIGETATVGSTLVTVADMSSLVLKGTIPQEALPYIKVGDSVDVTVDIYPDKTFQGTVSNIGAMSVSTGTYFPVEISLTNDENLSSGISAHADITAQGSKRLLVPITALVENNGQTYLFVIQDGVAKKQVVTTGLRNDDQVEIIQGLTGDEEVAITNASHLFDDMPVQIVKD